MEEPAYHRPKKGRPTEYAENTELLKTEIDASGIKTLGIHGMIWETG